MKKLVLLLTVLAGLPTIAMKPSNDANIKKSQKKIQPAAMKEYAPFKTLPIELILHILSFIDRPNWLNTMLVNKDWFNLMLNERLKEHVKHMENCSLSSKEKKSFFNSIYKLIELHKTLKEFEQYKNQEKVRWETIQFKHLALEIFFDTIERKTISLELALQNKFLEFAPLFDVTLEFDTENKTVDQSFAMELGKKLVIKSDF